MSQLFHAFRLAGYQGQMSPEGIPWGEAHAHQSVVWLASAEMLGEAPSEVASKLESLRERGETVLLESLLLEGRDAKVAEEEDVRIDRVSLSPDGILVAAVLQWVAY